MMETLLRTPTLHDACKERLLWVIGNLWPKPIYGASEVAIWTVDHFRLGHSWLQ